MSYKKWHKITTANTLYSSKLCRLVSKNFLFEGALFSKSISSNLTTSTFSDHFSNKINPRIRGNDMSCWYVQSYSIPTNNGKSPRAYFGVKKKSNWHKQAHLFSRHKFGIIFFSQWGFVSLLKNDENAQNRKRIKKNYTECLCVVARHKAIFNLTDLTQNERKNVSKIPKRTKNSLPNR